LGGELGTGHGRWWNHALPTVREAWVCWRWAKRALASAWAVRSSAATLSSNSYRSLSSARAARAASRSISAMRMYAMAASASARACTVGCVCLVRYSGEEKPRVWTRDGWVRAHPGPHPPRVLSGGDGDVVVRDAPGPMPPPSHERTSTMAAKCLLLASTAADASSARRDAPTASEPVGIGHTRSGCKGVRRESSRTQSRGTRTQAAAAVVGTGPGGETCHLSCKLPGRVVQGGLKGGAGPFRVAATRNLVRQCGL
jgi:hypothetical protein